MWIMPVRCDIVCCRGCGNFMSKVEEIIDRIPGWANAKDVQIVPLQGLTNTNFSVTVNGERFVIRISGQNATALGINRKHEIEALLAASKAGLGPEVVNFFLPEGHLVTRYIEGRHWTLVEYRTRDNLQRIVKAVKRLHALPLVEATFSPFQRVEAYAHQARAMGVPFPPDFDRLVHKMDAIKQDQARDTSHWQRFCHNDLFCVNVLDDGNVRFIDWEFAGVGDIYYDLATLFYAYDSADTLPPPLQEYVMECYFDEVHAENWHRLEGMKYMLMFFSAMWGLLQYGMQREGLVRIVEGFDFMEYANTTFKAMRAVL
jgi:thiamine kinase-like enzyme